MRIVELLNNITLPITNEEAEILDLLNDRRELRKSDLDERQQIMANHLVNKDVLYRINENGRIIYKKRIRSSGSSSS
jgi:transcription initiation factor IIE alpha subunit